MRTRLKIFLTLVLAVSLVVVVARSGDWFAPSAAATTVAQISDDDAGDAPATTTFDGAMVRKRAALAIHPGPGADRAHIARELRAAAQKAKVGSLTDATFAVFDEEMLNYLVPEMTFVFDEGVTAQDAGQFIRDHQPADVAFALAEPVLVHDLTFAVVPATGVTPASARDAQDREGVLSDSLNHYATTLQPAGLTVRYFGAMLSDGEILTVREAMGRAARVPATRVQVEANEPGPGIDLSHGVPHLEDAPPHHG